MITIKAVPTQAIFLGRVGENERLRVAFDVMDGANGADGATGPQGEPGFSPTVQVTDIIGGHPVAMTYAGMGRAVERLFNRCVQANPAYFKFALIG